MALLLYAITTPPTAELPTTLIHLEVDGLTAWASNVDGDASPFTREDLVNHHRVVTEVFERVEACLPARFPTVLADEVAIREELRTRAAELTTGLEAVRGAAELAITAVWTRFDEPHQVDAATPGRRYLLERRAALTASERQRAEAEHLADELERACGAAYRRAERHLCPSREVALSLALLVERTAAEEVKRALDQHIRPDVRILVHGPWPPYTFAQRRDGGAET